MALLTWWSFLSPSVDVGALLAGARWDRGLRLQRPGDHIPGFGRVNDIIDLEVACHADGLAMLVGGGNPPRA